MTNNCKLQIISIKDLTLLTLPAIFPFNLLFVFLPEFNNLPNPPRQQTWRKKIETDKNISLNSQLSHHIFLLHSISPSPYTRLFRAFSFLLKLPTSLTYPVYSAFSYLIKKLKQKLENFHDCLSPNQPTCRLLWPFTLPSFLLLWKNSLASI